VGSLVCNPTQAPHSRPRGDGFEKLINAIFSYCIPNAFQGSNRTGEQIDGQFYFDGHWYIEVRLRDERAKAADISVIRDRARNARRGVRAVMISYSGFTQECIYSLVGRSEEHAILPTGYDFRTVLECDIALDILLHDIRAYLEKYN
jgi:hypothetical protein